MSTGRWKTCGPDPEERIGLRFSTLSGHYLVGPDDPNAFVTYVREDVAAARLAEVEAERDRLRRRTHEIAEAKDAEHREAIGELARLRALIDRARERTRGWEVAWTNDPPSKEPYGWWGYTSSDAKMDIAAMRGDLEYALEALDDIKRTVMVSSVKRHAADRAHDIAETALEALARPSRSPNGSTAGTDAARPRSDAGCASHADSKLPARTLDRRGDGRAAEEEGPSGMADRAGTDGAVVADGSPADVSAHVGGDQPPLDPYGFTYTPRDGIELVRDAEREFTAEGYEATKRRLIELIEEYRSHVESSQTVHDLVGDVLDSYDDLERERLERERDGDLAADEARIDAEAGEA